MYEADRLSHAVHANHLANHRGSVFEVILGASSDFAKEDFFGGAPPEHAADLVEEFVFAHQILIISGQLQGIAEGGASARNNADLAYLVSMLAVVRHHGVANFMVCDATSVVGVQPSAFPLRPGYDFLDGFLQIFLTDGGSLVSRRKQRRFINHVSQVRTRKPRCLLGDLPEVDIGSQRLSAGMEFEDRLTSWEVRSVNDDLPIKASRTQQRSVQNIWAVGGR
jgi:hypothetical protein